VCTSRVTSNLSFYADQTTDLLDDRAGNVDDWAVWDYFGDFSDVAASLYVATTDDDPSGSPAWSGWMKFAVGDYTARAFKFKLTAQSSDVTHQIHVIGLSVTVDMPDRMQGSQNVSVASGGSNITYPSAFKAVPDLGVTVSDMATGDYLVLTGESETGFTVQVRDSGGTGVARTINWLARGYY